MSKTEDYGGHTMSVFAGMLEEWAKNYDDSQEVKDAYAFVAQEMREWVADIYPNTCLHCNGAGLMNIEGQSGNFTCPDCHGTGKSPNED